MSSHRWWWNHYTSHASVVPSIQFLLRNLELRVDVILCVFVCVIYIFIFLINIKFPSKVLVSNHKNKKKQKKKHKQSKFTSISIIDIRYCPNNFMIVYKFHRLDITSNQTLVVSH